MKSRTIWTNRKPFVVSKETHQEFRRIKKRFDCKLCGHIFNPGDKARWIYANSTPGMKTGNFFVCGDCDSEDQAVMQKAKDEFDLALKLAKRWDIYGPDWQ